MGEWTTTAAETKWGRIENEDEKRVVAESLAARVRDGDVIGVGSGSTAYLAIVEIAHRVQTKGLRVVAIPTSFEASQACRAHGLRVTDLTRARPDWGFDGADEVDPERRMIKGRGGAMFRERLVFAAAHERHILVDPSKLVDRLGTHFAVPVEVYPEAVNLVESSLRSELGATAVHLRRSGGGKDGPVITEAGNIVFDVDFDEIGDDLADRIAAVPGVVGSGLFTGFDYELHVTGR